MAIFIVTVVFIRLVEAMLALCSVYHKWQLKLVTHFIVLWTISLHINFAETNINQNTNSYKLLYDYG